ncbi:MAG TPA: RagB/SusD family nutrient uptake outer membrane protein [Chryseolinea sp.]
MKKLAYIYITFIFISCVDLDEDPESFLTADQFYQTEDQALAAVNAVYNGINNTTHTLYNRLMQIGTEMATDDYQAGPRARNAHVRAISGLTHDASNDRMQELWRQSYDVINRANIAVDKIQDNENVSEPLRSRLVNEAKFIRALMYFNLVRWFGGVPIILHETTTLSKESLYVTKATEDEVYVQIIQDLTDAEALPANYDGANVGRVTSGAAKSLLAKVYLTHEEWEKAALKSKEVIDSQSYGLFDNFADVFNVATKNGKEHIFSAQFKGYFNWNGNMLAGTSAPNEVPGINGDYGDALNSKSGLFASFSDSDERKAATFVTQIISPTNGNLYTFEPHLHKYYDETTPASPGQSSKNIAIIRYAEVLLIYAEALGQSVGPTAEAYWAVDEVRVRAGLEKLADTSPGLSQDDFREAVYEERRKELVFEYQRWFDLARRGPDYYVTRLTASGKTAAAPRHVHFPTPQRELDLNPNLVQHPDWINY